MRHDRGRGDVRENDAAAPPRLNSLFSHDHAYHERPGTPLLHRTLMVSAAVLASAVVGLLAFGIHREAAITPSPTAAQAPAQPSRPALTSAEERYIHQLWPIHGDVQRSTMRMTLGQIFYKTQDLGRAELGSRVEQALATYRAAETKLRALDPPASLLNEHDEYLSAVRLFQESAVELMKMFKDGQDDHMLAAYPKSQQGSDKIREVGGKFWPHEFPPH